MSLRRCPTCERLFDPGERFCSSDGTPLEAFASEDPRVGRVVGGRYRIQAMLGAGGMGVVYRAEQAGVERPVAIKLVRSDRVADEAASERFLREARAMSRLKSPHTVRVLDFGRTDEGELFLAMELLEGQTLRQRLGDGPLPLAEAVRVVDQIACSLSEAHADGLVHRDLKPDNVFLARSLDYPAFVKVLDFGIALTADARLTHSSEIPGTPGYVAPERVSGEPVDVRADVYALGVLLYELLCGAPPFGARGAEPWDVLMAHLQEDPPPFDPALGVPPPLADLVWRCLAKVPRLRPADASAFRAELAAALAPAATPGDALSFAPGPRPLPPPTVDARRPDPRPPGRPRPVATRPAALAAAFVAVALAAFALGRATPAPPTPARALQALPVPKPPAPAPAAPTSAPAPAPAVPPEPPSAAALAAPPPTRVTAGGSPDPAPPAAAPAPLPPPAPAPQPEPDPSPALRPDRPRPRPAPRPDKPAPGDQRRRIELLLD